MTTTEQTTEDMLDLIERTLAPEDFPAEFATALAVAADCAIDPQDHPELAETLEAWRIDGENTALWAATKLRRAYDRRAQAAATAEKLRKMADEHVAKAIADTDRDVRYFTSKLRQYHEAEVDGTRRKTTTLPDGTVLAGKVGSVTSHVTDDEAERAALLDFLESHTDEVPGAVEYPDPTILVSKIKAAGTDEKVDKTEPGDYPAAIPATGEVIPGVTYKRGEPTFDVKLGDLTDDE